MDSSSDSTWRRVAGAALLAVPFVLGACATAPEPLAVPEGTALEAPIRDLAERLVDVAELRTDLSSVRACVHEIRETRPPTAPSIREPGAPDAIGVELAGEFELALAGRLHVVDSGEPPEGGGPKDPLEGWKEIAARLGVTHLLVGEYTRGAIELVLTVRLVEAESRLIVAAARGRVPLSSLTSLRSEEELERLTEASPRPQIPPLREPSADRPAHFNGRLAVGDDSAPTPLTAAETSPAPPVAVTRTGRQPRYPLGQPAANPEDFETWRARVGDLLGPRTKRPAQPRPDPEPAIGPAALRLRAQEARSRP